MLNDPYFPSEAARTRSAEMMGTIEAESDSQGRGNKYSSFPINVVVGFIPVVVFGETLLVSRPRLCC